MYYLWVCFIVTRLKKKNLFKQDVFLLFQNFSHFTQRSLLLKNPSRWLLSLFSLFELNIMPSLKPKHLYSQVYPLFDKHLLKIFILSTRTRNIAFLPFTRLPSSIPVRPLVVKIANHIRLFYRCFAFKVW